MPIAIVQQPQKREALRTLLACVYPSVARLERRGERRYPYPYLIQVTPVDLEGARVSDQQIVVVGKQISEHGLGFYHQSPLEYRQVIVGLQRCDGPRVEVKMDLTWCRFTQLGWYESGGRFLEVVSPEGDDTGNHEGTKDTK